MTSTDLKLEDVGTLPPPGPVGRLFRLIFGGLSLYYVYGLWSVWNYMMTEDGHIEPLIWNGVFASLLLVSYVINIGYSRDWKKRPALFSLIYLLVIGFIGLQSSGDWENTVLATGIVLWELYIFLHLGLCFILAAIIGTPGCEMRAFHHLYGIATGTDTKEHHCPIGPLSAIDRWERKIVR
ncbi:hypothetical protein [Kordiimonas laminariae]|uniref:hypothetical protein n=1 Tax=Kordiimonas laminariae TaxID=2917717 RepID=UPI001FF52B20|nr:hypothetical protein [Kordiimonas laminariae]MCK0070730.1 hypothetical protein [Kordiimonas laminariae]